ncbi:MAG: hypothetical protein KDD40_07760 [Bdellovibrionales bacterium]|nr:hypothetical protein [Bdellovibrionales bacterium]
MIKSILFIFIFNFLSFTVVAKTAILGSQFDILAYKLLTDKNTELPLSRLIAILDEGEKPVFAELRILKKLYQLAQQEQQPLDYEYYQLIRNSVEEQQQLKHLLSMPLGLISTALIVDVSTDLPLFIKLLYSLGTLGYVGYNFFPEIRQTPNSEIQMLKRQVASTLLLAKIQWRVIQKDEGFPWPFQKNPDCNLVLSKALENLKLK